MCWLVQGRCSAVNRGPSMHSQTNLDSTISWRTKESLFWRKQLPFFVLCRFFSFPCWESCLSSNSLIKCYVIQSYPHILCTNAVTSESGTSSCWTARARRPLGGRLIQHTSVFSQRRFFRKHNDSFHYSMFTPRLKVRDGGLAIIFWKEAF